MASDSPRVSSYPLQMGRKVLKHLLLAAAVSLSVFGASAATAAPSCTGWMSQPDGSQFRTCVGDDGRQYCESCKGNSCSRVSCR